MKYLSANQNNGRADGPGSQNSILNGTKNTSNPQDVDWGPGSFALNEAEPTQVLCHTLAFGLRRRDGTVVSEAEWQTFADANLPTSFPNGYSVLDGAGGWPEPKGIFVREPSRLVLAYVPLGQPFVGATVAALALLWKTQAQQDCVLWACSSARTVNL